MFSNTKILGAVCSVAALLLAASKAVADDPLPEIPTNYNVVYRIHDDPNDPNSPITFAVWLKLTSRDVDGHSVGWEIDEIRFRDPNSSGDTIWTESDPDVPTADGLWWVEHDDVENPLLKEFGDPPHLKGTAAANDPNDVDLDYDFQGSTYSGSPPWSSTAGLDYDFELVETPPASVASGTDGPVEVANDDDDPPAS